MAQASATDQPLLAALSAVVGAEHVITEGPLLRRQSQDVYRSGELPRYVLGKQRHRDTASRDHITTVYLDIPFQDSQKRRLAGTVPPQQSDTVVGFDATCDSVQQRRSSESNADVA